MQVGLHLATSIGYGVGQKSAPKKYCGDRMITEEHTKEVRVFLYKPDFLTKNATNLGFPGQEK